MDGTKIVLVGLEKTIKDLKKFDTDSVKKFQQTINTELKQVKIEAQISIPDNPPMSGWSTNPPKNPHPTTRGGRGWPAWNAAEIKSGIKATRAQGKVRKGDYTTSAGALLNKTAAGVIFEIVGRHKNSSSDSESNGNSKQFIENIKRYGSASRVVWRAVDKNRTKIEMKFKNALDQAKTDLQNALDSNK